MLVTVILPLIIGIQLGQAGRMDDASMLCQNTSIFSCSLQGEVSYNRPKFNACSAWKPDGTVLATMSDYWRGFSGLFINTNNYIYSIVYGTGTIFVWQGMNNTLVMNISTNQSKSNGLFVNVIGTIYVPDGETGRIVRWENSTHQDDYSNISTLFCYTVFFDLDDAMYCSVTYGHQVRIQTVGMAKNDSRIIAGSYCIGDAPDQLIYPQGIFVDSNFTLYVADAGNHRIQRFFRNENNGTTVAGVRAAESFRLYFPTSVILDADGFLFIADSKNDRIVRSGPGGFRCILGCTGSTAALNHQLKEPLTISFDVEGNIFVTVSGNQRIMRFSLTSDSCRKSKLKNFHSWMII